MKKYLMILMLLSSTSAFSQTNEDKIPVSTLPISQHYQALPFLFNFDKVPVEHLSSLISRQYVMGANSMLVRWVFKKGAMIPLQKHISEQITWITQGSVKVFSQGKEFIMHAGDVMIIPPFVPHQFIALEETVDIDFFAPVRTDWLDAPFHSNSQTNVTPDTNNNSSIDPNAVPADTAGRRG